MPIQPELDRINAITDRNGLLAEVARLHAMGYAPLFRVSGQNDFKNSKMIIASVGTGQLGLPDRDYYLRDDERFKNTRSQYVDHVTTMLTLAGEDATQARSDAERILQLETKLAQRMRRVEMRAAGKPLP
jgi:putative endopeptidase